MITYCTTNRSNQAEDRLSRQKMQWKSELPFSGKFLSLVSHERTPGNGFLFVSMKLKCPNKALYQRRGHASIHAITTLAWSMHERHLCVMWSRHAIACDQHVGSPFGRGCGAVHNDDNDNNSDDQNKDELHNGSVQGRSASLRAASKWIKAMPVGAVKAAHTHQNWSPNCHFLALGIVM